MEEKKEKIIKIARILVAGIMLAVLNLLDISGTLNLILYILTYLIIGYDLLLEAWEGITEGEIFSEEFLMVIATMGAFALSIINGSGDYNEAIFVVLFFQVGELFEDIAVDKSRDNIAKLMDIRPDYANMETDGEMRRVSPSEVQVDSIITVLPGERVPLDGVVIQGNSSMDTSALTGESVPRDVFEGESVFSGCINLSGALKIRTTKEAGQSTVSKILELVENASEHKANSENFITKFSKVYTPIVCGLALLLAVLPPLGGLVFGYESMWLDWIYRALTFLVISCPCALVISVPLSFFVGIGKISHQGVLVKGSNYIELLTKIDTIVFDKTGTLTKGEGSLGVTWEGREYDTASGSKLRDMPTTEILQLAALAESASTHPIAKSIYRTYGEGLDISRVKNVQEKSGYGITANVDGHKVSAGNYKLMDFLGIDATRCDMSSTVVYVAIDGEFAGHFIISDEIKETSKEAIDRLKKLGIKKTVMLTGDNEHVAMGIARVLEIDEYHAGLLPADKVAIVERLMSGGGSTAAESAKMGARRSVTAFVGDGINDAPVIMRADLGIAMGALGSDATIEAADVVLMRDDLSKLPVAIKTAKTCMRKVIENIVFSLAVKFACLILVALGVANMGLAVFADVGVLILAVLNAVSVLWVSHARS